MNDTVADKIITVTIVKLTAKGESDIPVATVEVPVDKLEAAFANAEKKNKSFTFPIKNMQGQVVGQFKNKIMFTKELLKTEEEKKDEEVAPAGNVVI